MQGSVRLPYGSKIEVLEFQMLMTFACVENIFDAIERDPCPGLPEASSTGFGVLCGMESDNNLKSKKLDSSDPVQKSKVSLNCGFGE